MSNPEFNSTLEIDAIRDLEEYIAKAIQVQTKLENGAKFEELSAEELGIIALVHGINLDFPKKAPFPDQLDRENLYRERTSQVIGNALQRSQQPEA